VTDFVITWFKYLVYNLDLYLTVIVKVKLKRCHYFVFSAPDHKVVKVRESDGRFSDGAMSGVRCRSSSTFGLLTLFRLFLMISRPNLKIGHLRSKTRSQELKIEKSC
jgi:hypothetical protein